MFEPLLAIKLRCCRSDRRKDLPIVGVEPSANPRTAQAQASAAAAAAR
jgi:hypothetical protein